MTFSSAGRATSCVASDNDTSEALLPTMSEAVDAREDDGIVEAACSRKVTATQSNPAAGAENAGDCNGTKLWELAASNNLCLAVADKVDDERISGSSMTRSVSMKVDDAYGGYVTQDHAACRDCSNDDEQRTEGKTVFDLGDEGNFEANESAAAQTASFASCSCDRDDSGCEGAKHGPSDARANSADCNRARCCNDDGANAYNGPKICAAASNLGAFCCETACNVGGGNIIEIDGIEHCVDRAAMTESSAAEKARAFKADNYPGGGSVSGSVCGGRCGDSYFYVGNCGNIHGGDTSSEGCGGDSTTFEDGGRKDGGNMIVPADGSDTLSREICDQEGSRKGVDNGQFGWDIGLGADEDSDADGRCERVGYGGEGSEGGFGNVVYANLVADEAVGVQRVDGARLSITTVQAAIALVAADCGGANNIDKIA
eukprot:6187172-Pleurochrysis_carterae.AAC.1